MPIVARRRGAASERRVCRVGSSSTATLSARGIIGRNIKGCKQRVAELRDEALLFKDPPPKEDCPICCIPSQ